MLDGFDALRWLVKCRITIAIWNWNWFMWWKHFGHEEGPLPLISVGVHLKLGGWQRSTQRQTEAAPFSRPSRHLMPWLNVEGSLGEAFSHRSCSGNWLVSLLQELSCPPPAAIRAQDGDALVISASTKGRCEGNMCTRVKPLCACTASVLGRVPVSEETWISLSLQLTAKYNVVFRRDVAGCPCWD